MEEDERHFFFFLCCLGEPRKAARAMPPTHFWIALDGFGLTRDSLESGLDWMFETNY